MVDIQHTWQATKSLGTVATGTQQGYRSRQFCCRHNPRGPWQSVSASVQAGHAVASQFYTIISPAGLEFDPPKGRCWAYNQEKMLREIAEHNIWFGLEGRNTPRIKKFLANAKIGLTPETQDCTPWLPQGRSRE